MTDADADDHDARLRAIGQAVQAASILEYSVRDAFCALVGSKYAAVVAGAISSVGAIIDHCQAIIIVHREMDESVKSELSSLLRECAEVSKERNRLIHDMWGMGPDDGAVQVRLIRHAMTTRVVDLAHIRETVNKLNSCSARLTMFLAMKLGPGLSSVGAQLRWEEHVASMSPEQRSEIERRVRDANSAQGSPSDESDAR